MCCFWHVISRKDRYEHEGFSHSRTRIPDDTDSSFPHSRCDGQGQWRWRFQGQLCGARAECRREGWQTLNRHGRHPCRPVQTQQI